MSDPKDNKKSEQTTPFNKDPFSVDVWERAYKNVGRPFASAEKKEDNTAEVSIQSRMSPPSPQGAASKSEKKPTANKTQAQKNGGISVTTPTSPSYSSRTSAASSRTQSTTASSYNKSSTASQSSANSYHDSKGEYEDIEGAGDLITLIIEKIEEGLGIEIPRSITDAIERAKKRISGISKRTGMKEGSIIGYIFVIIVIVIAIIGLAAS